METSVLMKGTYQSIVQMNMPPEISFRFESLWVAMECEHGRGETRREVKKFALTTLSDFSGIRHSFKLERQMERSRVGYENNRSHVVDNMIRIM